MSTTKDVFGEPFGDTKNAYPEVFNNMPVQPKERKPGQLTDQQIKQFFDQGYLIVEDYVDTSLLDSVKTDLEKIVDHLANVLYKAGKLKTLYSEYEFYQRLAKMEEDYPGSAMLMHKTGFLSDSIKKLWENDNFLNCMEQFLGTRDIQGHPVWNIRTKVPNNEATVVPWHQDVGYTDNDSHQVLTMTAWIPLLNTNARNGCMEDGTVFDVLNPGPWIQKWEVTNKNQHVAALENGLRDSKSKTELLTYHALPQTVKN